MSYKHGHAVTGRVSPEYMSWSAMIQRCNNPNSSRYKYYGGRGIKVCERWLIFENFLADMGPRPSGLTLDRIENNGDYELSNCQWSTRTEQNNNKRNIKNSKEALFYFVCKNT